MRAFNAVLNALSTVLVYYTNDNDYHDGDDNN